MKLVKAYLVIFATTMIVAVCVLIWFSNYRGYLITEDSLVENLSNIFFLLSFLLCIVFYFKSNIHRKAFILLSAIGLLGLLEEISFGERILGFKALKIDGVKIDSVHDFFKLGCKLIKKLAIGYPVYAFIFTGIGIIAAIILLSKYRYQLIETISKILRRPVFIFFAIFSILISISLLIDLGLVRVEALFMVEEMFEMNAAIALLFCCLSLYSSDRRN